MVVKGLLVLLVWWSCEAAPLRGANLRHRIRQVPEVAQEDDASTNTNNEGLLQRAEHAIEDVEEMVPNWLRHPLSPQAQQSDAQQPKHVHDMEQEPLPSAEAPQDFNGVVAEEGTPLKYPFVNHAFAVPLLDGNIKPVMDPEQGVMEINTEFDPMKPKALSIWGNPEEVLFLGEMRTRRHSNSYYGHLGPLQPGDKGTKIYQRGTSDMAPSSPTSLAVGELFDTRPTVVTSITQAKLLSPNMRHRFIPGYALQGLCADKATGLPKPCLSLATLNAAPSRIEADRLGYDPFGVNNPPWWARKKILQPPDLAH